MNVATTCPHCKAPTGGNVDPHCRDTQTDLARTCGWVRCKSCRQTVDLKRDWCACGTPQCFRGGPSPRRAVT